MEITQKYPSKIDLKSLEKEWGLLTEPTTVFKDVDLPLHAEPPKCRHKMLTGPRRGENCGVEVKTTGQFYCVKHYKKYEDGALALREVTPSFDPPPIKSELIIRLDKSIGKFTHKFTGMVFQSYTIRKVCGRVENDKILPLNEGDIETCKKYGFEIY